MTLWIAKIGRYGAATVLGLVVCLNVAFADGPDTALQAAFDRMMALAAEGRYEDAISAGSRALELAESAQDPNSQDAGTILYRLGNLYYQKGDKQSAERLLRRALAVFDRPDRGVSVSLARILNNLGYVLTDLERFAEAERIFLRHVSVLEELGESEITQLGTAHKNLGRLYDRWGRPENAESSYRTSLSIFERDSEANDWLIDALVNDMAAFYHRRGRLDEAEEHYRRALDLRKSRYGSDHQKVVDTLYDLIGLFQAQGRYAETEPFYRQLVTIFEKWPDSPGYAEVLAGLAHALTMNERYEDAEALLRQVLEITLEANGGESLEVAEVYYKLAFPAYRKGDFETARARYLRAFELFEAAAPSGHLRLAKVRGFLADTERSLGNLEQAETWYRDALARFELSGGPARPGWRENALDLVTLLARQGRVAETDPILARYVEGAATEEDVDRLLVSLQEVINEAWSEERYEATEQVLNRAITVAEGHTGLDHPKRASLQLDLAVLLARAKRKGEAETAFLRAIERYEQQDSADPASLAHAQLLLAEQWADEKRDDRAAAMLEVANGNFERSENAPPGEVVQGLTRLAQIRGREGNGATADALFKRAVDLTAEKFGRESEDFATIHWSWAESYKDRGNYEEAARLFQRSMELDENAGRGDTLEYALAAESLAYLLYDWDRYFEAEPLFKAALAIRESRLGVNNPQVADTLIALGDLYRDIGKFEPARDAYARALQIREQNYPESQETVIWAMERVANIAGSSGDLAMEEQIHHHILKRLERAGKTDHELYSEALRDLAFLQMTRRRLDDAESFARQALSTDERVFGRDDPGIVKSLGILASVYLAQTRFFDAAALQLRRLAILEAQPGASPSNMAAALRDLAKVKHALGKKTDAIELIERAFELSVLDGQAGPAGRARALRTLGMDYLAFGRAAKAEDALRQALDLDEMVFGPDHAYVAMDLIGIANARMEQQDSRRAIDVYERAFNLMAKHFGPDYPMLSILSLLVPSFYLAEGRIDDAARLFKETLPKFRRLFGGEDALGPISTLWQAIIAMKRNRSAEAIGQLRKNVALLRGQIMMAQTQQGGGSAGRNFGQAGQLLLIAAVARAAGEQPAARQELMNEAFETAQLGNIGVTAGAVTRMAVRFGLDDDELGRLVRRRQDAAERWLFLNTRLVEAAGKPLSERNQLEERASREKMAELSAAMSSFDQELKRAFPDYAELVQPEPMGIAEVQQLLAPDEALMFYRTFETLRIEALDELVTELVPATTILLVVRRDQSELYWLDVTRRDLEKQVAGLRRALDYEGEEIPHFDRQAAFDLYRRIFVDAEGFLTGVRHIMVVPDGALQSLPLGVLVTEKPQGPFFDFSRYAQVPWLAKKYAITTIPSVSSLRALRRPARPAAAQVAFAGFGNPTLQGAPGSDRGIKINKLFRGALADVTEVRQLYSLPETEDELRAIAAALQASDEAVYVRDDATETKVKSLDLSNRRILAFATHGLVAGDIGDIAEPALVLTPPETATPLDDGLLTASEIARLDLNAEWVILSACNTAAPGAEGAEGLSGLAKAFFFAGSRALLVSHWPVDSEASVRITTGIFNALREDPTMRRSEALRRAVQALISDREQPFFAHPFFWAPFVVVGDGGRPQAAAADAGN